MIKRFVRRRKAGILWLAALLCWLAPLTACTQQDETESWKRQTVTLDVLPSGKSDCMLLRMDGLVFLIDTADADDAELIDEILALYGITRIDYLILTHYDNDHVGSAAAVVRGYEIGRVLGPAYERDSARMRELAEALAKKELRLEALTEDLTLQSAGGSVWINVTREMHDLTEESEENNESLILSVRHGETGLLLLGDALKERTAEYNALPAVFGQSWDLVKLPHHGDWNKALSVLLEGAAPRYAISCVGTAEQVEDKLTGKCSALGVTHCLSCDGLLHATVTADEKLSLTQRKG